MNVKRTLVYFAILVPTLAPSLLAAEPSEAECSAEAPQVVACDETLDLASKRLEIEVEFGGPMMIAVGSFDANLEGPTGTVRVTCWSAGGVGWDCSTSSEGRFRRSQTVRVRVLGAAAVGRWRLSVVS